GVEEGLPVRAIGDFIAGEDPALRVGPDDREQRLHIGGAHGVGERGGGELGRSEGLLDRAGRRRNRHQGGCQGERDRRRNGSHRDALPPARPERLALPRERTACAEDLLPPAPSKPPPREPAVPDAEGEAGARCPPAACVAADGVAADCVGVRPWYCDLACVDCALAPRWYWFATPWSL